MATPELAHRVQALEAAFDHIARTRMQGLPVLNPALRVQALGFEPLAGEDAGLALGVLITPWFMNLVRLPIAPPPAEPPATLLRPGEQGSRPAGHQALWFTGAEEEAIGRYELCSLRSPMYGLPDPAAAAALAQEVLAMLRSPAPEPAHLAASATPATPHTSTDAPVPPPLPARRGFLFGRSARGA